MIATAVNYRALVEAMPPGAVTFLNNVSWDDYEDILREFDEQRHLRLTYDNGRMEIMTLSPLHERIAALIPHLIFVLAQELNLNFLSLGSTTFKKSRNEQGTEPDDCFYFREFEKVSKIKKLDLSIDPPPDLALEIDISHPSLDKLPIYANIGVPELWLFNGVQMSFHRLVGGRYVEVSNSDLFTFLTPDVLLEFLRRGEEKGVMVMAKEFGEWVKTNKK